MRTIRISLAKLEQARHLRMAGKTTAEIRRIIGATCSEAGLWKHIRDVPCNRGRKVDGLAALRLKAEGLTYKQIGERFNASAVAAFKAARRAASRSQQREAA